MFMKTSGKKASDQKEIENDELQFFLHNRAEKVEFWETKSTTQVLKAISKVLYPPEIIRHYQIIDIASVKHPETLLCFKKRERPLTDEELRRYLATP